MKSILTIWTFALLAAITLPGCGPSEVAAPTDMSADQEAEAERRFQQVENEEKMHNQQMQGN